MNEAAQCLVGEHDFRNLCKMDVGNGVINYMRTIMSASVQITNNVWVIVFYIINKLMSFLGTDVE